MVVSGRTVVGLTYNSSDPQQHAVAWVSAAPSPFELKTNLLAQLIGLRDQLTDKEDRDKLSDAIEHLQKVCFNPRLPDRWLTPETGI